MLAVALLVVASSIAQPPEQTPATKKLVKIAAKVADGDVCDAAELKTRDGSPTILATIDYSGRRFCNITFRIRPTAPPIVIQQLPVGTPDRLSDLLRDLDGDGYPEIIAGHTLTPYRGGRCAGWVPDVYKCDSRRCAKQTLRFPEFLHFELASRESDVDKAISERASAEDVACLEMSRDKLKRLLRIDPNAGFSEAKTWLTSHDSTLRENAALVLLDIDSGEARAILDSLIDDKDPDVARIARIYRDKRAKQKSKH